MLCVDLETPTEKKSGSVTDLPTNLSAYLASYLTGWVLEMHLKMIHKMETMSTNNLCQQYIELRNYMLHADSISPWSFTFPMALKYTLSTVTLMKRMHLIESDQNCMNIVYTQRSHTQKQKR